MAFTPAFDKPVVAVDFDGVINSYRSGFTGLADLPDPPEIGRAHV